MNNSNVNVFNSNPQILNTSRQERIFKIPFINKKRLSEDFSSNIKESYSNMQKLQLSISNGQSHFISENPNAKIEKKIIKLTSKQNLMSSLSSRNISAPIKVKEPLSNTTSFKSTYSISLNPKNDELINSNRNGSYKSTIHQLDKKVLYSSSSANDYLHFLKRELRDTQQKNSELIDIYNQTDKKVTSLSEEQKILKEKYEQISKRYDALLIMYNKQKDIGNIGKENFAKELNEKDEIIQLNKKKISILEGENNDLKKSLIEKEEKILNMKRTIDLLTEIANIESDKKTHKEAKEQSEFNKKKENEINNLKNQMTKLKNLLKETEEKLSKAELENLNLKEENNSLKAQTKKYITKINSLLETLKLKEEKSTSLSSIINPNSRVKRNARSHSQGNENFIYQKITTKNYKKLYEEEKHRTDQLCKRVNSLDETLKNILDIKNNNNTNSSIYNANTSMLQKSQLKQDPLDKTTEDLLITQTPAISTSDVVIKNINIYRIFDYSNFLKFNLLTKKFSIIPIDTSKDNFISNYSKNETLTLNTSNNFYICTGKDTNILYSYSPQSNLIQYQCTFKYNHNKGSLLYDELKRCIIVLSGTSNRKVEAFSLESKAISTLPEMNLERSDASFCITNNIIYAFFGYSYKIDKYISLIEYLNLTKCDKWEYLNYRGNRVFELKSHIALPIPNKQMILITGGIMGEMKKAMNSLIQFNIHNCELNILDINISEEKDLDKPNIFSSNALVESSVSIGINDDNSVYAINDILDFQTFYF